MSHHSITVGDLRKRLEGIDDERLLQTVVDEEITEVDWIEAFKSETRGDEPLPSFVVRLWTPEV